MATQYLTAANVIEGWLKHRGGLINLCFGNKRNRNPSMVYRLSVETLKHRKIIEQIVKEAGAADELYSMRKALVNVMIYELVIGEGKIRGLVVSIFRRAC